METRSDLRKDTVDALRDLAKMNHDAAEGYADAAESVDDEAVAKLFRAASDERRSFANELVVALKNTGEDAPDGGTVKGAVHRAWLNFRGALNGGDAEVIVKEAVRGESALVDAYDDCLKETVGSPLNTTLHAQLQGVRQTRDGLQALGDTIS